MADGLPDDVAFCACNTLRKTARAVTQLYDEVLKPSGLRATQFSLLAVVTRAGAATMAELADALVMDRTTLTRNLKPLKARGLIQSVESEDRRERRIAVTDAGRRALVQAVPLWRKAQEKVAGGLGKGRWAGMMRDLNAAVRLVLAK